MELPRRASVPPAMPTIDPQVARDRHRDGMSCKTVATYVYDANGHQRWCSDCGTELGEQAWVQGGAEVPRAWLIGAACLLVGVLLLVALLMALPPSGANQEDSGGIGGGPGATPTTYGPPDGNPNPGVRSLPRPTPLHAPVVR